MGRPLLFNHTGEVFGELTVLRQGARKGTTYWICRCSCGVEKEIAGHNLRSGDIRSCGCKQLELISKALKGKYLLHGHTQGGIQSPEWRAWNGMLHRCYSKYGPSYARYGGRGIKVCARWRNSFENFLEDMGPRPSSKHSIDRKKNNRGYNPGNCRWATALEQQNNKSSNRHLSFRGRTQTLSLWAREAGLKASTIWRRLEKYGWSVERALTTPPIPPKLRCVRAINST